MSDWFTRRYRSFVFSSTPPTDACTFPKGVPTGERCDVPGQYVYETLVGETPVRMVACEEHAVQFDRIPWRPL